ncbi:hypothetical protein C8Q79DRAFT_944984 [Trametes meyenii]|nr:hypothetical protein C8Q79DRAFT_944984 [Trametes meyenii]
MQPDLDGVLQLVVDLGFREKTEDFVTYYVFSGSKSANNRLRVGTSMIKEAIEFERQKLEDEERRLAQEESERKAHMQKIHLQIYDDRLSVAARAQRERHSGYKEMGIPGRKSTPAKGKIATLHGEV